MPNNKIPACSAGRQMTTQAQKLNDKYQNRCFDICVYAFGFIL